MLSIFSHGNPSIVDQCAVELVVCVINLPMFQTLRFSFILLAYECNKLFHFHIDLEQITHFPAIYNASAIYLQDSDHVYYNGGNFFRSIVTQRRNSLNLIEKTLILQTNRKNRH